MVKELVENALDAGATEITIETRLGGKKLIKVADNGVGMSYDDLRESVKRQPPAKSKDRKISSESPPWAFGRSISLHRLRGNCK